MLRIENICKKYGEHTALDAVSMEVPKGSIFGLLGPNGAGKTSLIRIINQIVLPDAGEVWFDGELLQPKHTAQIGYLPRRTRFVQIDESRRAGVVLGSTERTEQRGG